MFFPCWLADDVFLLMDLFQKWLVQELLGGVTITHQVGAEDVE